MVAVWQNGIRNEESGTTFTHRHTQGVLLCASGPIKAVMDKEWTESNISDLMFHQISVGMKNESLRFLIFDY